MADVLEDIARRSKSFDEADFLPSVFGTFRSEAVGGKTPVVLFGAGSAGRELCPTFRRHGVCPVAFCDNNPERIGGTWCDLPVLSAAEVVRSHRHGLVVVTVGRHGEAIRDQLGDLGFPRERVLLIEDHEALCYYTHLDQWYWSEEDLQAHRNELARVYGLLSDQKSRDLLAARIALFTHGADFGSFWKFILAFCDIRDIQGTDFSRCTLFLNGDTEAYLQFNNDVLRLRDGEVLVDGGAFNGDSTLEFVKACDKQGKRYGKVFCFEPDARMFAQLKQNTAKLKNVVLRPCGLWSQPGSIRFVDSQLVRPGSSRLLDQAALGDLLESAGRETEEVPVTSLDGALKGETVSLIKMDVEGAEVDALRGARETIARCRPALIVSVYHKRNDLFEIPLVIEEAASGYRMYLRHFSRNFSETTLFAIPR